MAVVAPPPLHNKRDFWGSGRAPAFPLESPASMTDIMSYQYPPPPPNGADMGIPPTEYVPAYDPSGEMDMRSNQDPNLPIKDRRDSFSKLKRSMSTPSVRPQLPQQQQAAPQSHLSQQLPPDHSVLGLAGDKRRNKLGYHRTSVACGHCRRRKIRCIPSPQDPQGRCVNCIRLKKECSFFPVDQQPPPDTQQKSSSRSSVGPKITSASSSPAIPSGHPADMHGQQHYPPQLSMPSIQTMAPPSLKPVGAESFSPESKMPSSASSSRAFEYGHGGMTNWMSADASPSSSKAGDLNNSWRSYPQESPVTPAFSPFTPHAPPPSATWTAPAGGEHSSREELSWSYPPPPRSMSFGSESMSSQQHHHHHHHHHQQQQQYPPISQIAGASRSFDRKSGPMSADIYPPPIATTIPGVESIPGTTLEHNVSLSAGAVPPPNYGSWQQPSYSSYSAKHSESYPSWYGENGSTQQPLGSEEQHVHPATESQQSGPTLYYPSR